MNYAIVVLMAFIWEVLIRRRPIHSQWQIVLLLVGPLCLFLVEDMSLWIDPPLLYFPGIVVSIGGLALVCVIQWVRSLLAKVEALESKVAKLEERVGWVSDLGL